jgi:hypothetical protein
MPIHYQYMTGRPQTPANNPAVLRAPVQGHGFVICARFSSSSSVCEGTIRRSQRIVKRLAIDRRRFHLDTGGIISVL